jgi:RimJ/RimL family protein N-acetyltransferase
MLWGPNSEEESQEFLKRKLAEQEVCPRVNYSIAITFKENDQLIGGCAVKRKSVEASDGEIGYVLHKDYWGRGIATEAVEVLLRFGFEELKLHRIFATCMTENLGSKRVLEKNGLRLEGHLKENVLQRGRWRDSLIYAILDYEWIQLNT